MWGSKLLGNYAAGAAGKFGPAASAAGGYAMGAGRALGMTGGGAVGGAAIGGMYGMMSDDTSVLGGALMGAGLGAAGMRYGPRGVNAFRGAGRGGAGIGGGLMAAGRGMYRGARADVMGGYNAVKGGLVSNTRAASNAANARAVASSANVGATLASNGGVNPMRARRGGAAAFAGMSGRDIAGAPGAEEFLAGYGRQQAGARARMGKYFGPIG